MNGCHFLGKLTCDPVLKKSHESLFVNFTLEVEEYRRDKNGVKRRRIDLLNFEAWDSAAKTIQERAQKDDLMIIDAIARNEYTEEPETVVFRITNFKIIPKRDLDR
tara:strand:+ start:125 stop:442 length:318 start_codon:yes stop_codon:yes gene_type:complete